MKIDLAHRFSHRTLAGLRFDAMGRCRIGEDIYTNPEDMVDTIEEMLATMAVAGEYADESKRKFIRGDLSRAYPIFPERGDDDGRVKRFIDSALSSSLEPQSLVREVSDYDAVVQLAPMVTDEVLGRPLRVSVFEPWHRSGNDLVEPGCSWIAVQSLRGENLAKWRKLLNHSLLGNAYWWQIAGYQVNPRDGDSNFWWDHFISYGFRKDIRIVSGFFPDGTTPDVKRSFQQKLSEELDNAYAIAFKRRYEWEVEFSLCQRRTGIVVSTDVEGVRLMLAERERVPFGRRKALLHWVRSHYRHSPAPVEDDRTLCFVRQHLKGAKECSYGGMWCRIYPSTYDLNRACNGKRFEGMEDG